MEAHQLPDYAYEPEPSHRQPRPAVRRSLDRPRAAILIVAVVVIVGALIFWLQNHQHVSISYLSVTINAPLWLAVTGYFLAGVLVGVLLTLYYRRQTW